jgi:magnesium chelatase family protein
MHVEVPRRPFEPGEGIDASGETADAAARVHSARSVQRRRSGRLNARLERRDLLRVAFLAPRGRAILERAAEQWKLSTRSCDRILKLARTIADLDGQGDVATLHVAEAVQLRCLDRPL